MLAQQHQELGRIVLPTPAQLTVLGLSPGIKPVI
jgi:hypothetical protein